MEFHQYSDPLTCPVSMCDREASMKWKPCPIRGFFTIGQKKPYSLHSNGHLTHCQCHIHQPTDGGTFLPQTVAQPK
jgi:hypothetical protein